MAKEVNSIFEGSIPVPGEAVGGSAKLPEGQCKHCVEVDAEESACGWGDNSKDRN